MKIRSQGKYLIPAAVIGVLLAAAIIWFALNYGNQTTTEAPVETPQPAALVNEPPKQEYPVLLVRLGQQNGSGQQGTATLEGMAGNKTKVTLRLTGGAYTQQPAHIHNGSCPNPGAVKYPLTAVNSNFSETVIDTDLETLVKSGTLAINVHKSAQEASVYTSCGDLPKPL